MTDPNSHSNPEECLVTHISLLWDVDFERKVLSGSAELIVERQIHTADKIVSSYHFGLINQRFLVFSMFLMELRWHFSYSQFLIFLMIGVFIQSTHTQATW